MFSRALPNCPHFRSNPTGLLRGVAPSTLPPQTPPNPPPPLSPCKQGERSRACYLFVRQSRHAVPCNGFKPPASRGERNEFIRGKAPAALSPVRLARFTPKAQPAPTPSPFSSPVGGKVALQHSPRRHDFRFST